MKPLFIFFIILISVFTANAQGNSGWKVKTDDYGNKSDVFKYSPNTGTEFKYDRQEEKYTPSYVAPNREETEQLIKQAREESQKEAAEAARLENQRKIDYENLRPYIFSEGDKYGFRSVTKINIPAIYEHINGSFGESGDEDYTSVMVPVMLNGKCGMINWEGNTQIGFRYDNIIGTIDFAGRNKYATAAVGNKWGCISIFGDELPCIYDEPLTFSGNIAYAKLNGVVVNIDMRTKNVLPVKFDRMQFSYQLDKASLLSYKGKWGVYTDEWKEVIPIKYDTIMGFKNDLAQMNLNGKWGCITTKGIVKVEPLYDNLRYDSDARIIAVKNGKSGVVNSEGKELIAFKYDEIAAAKDPWAAKYGWAVLTLNKKKGLADTNGTILLPPLYDEEITCSEDYLVPKLNGKKGLFDKSGKEIVPPKYDDLVVYGKDWILAELNGKKGVIDNTGKIIIPIKYSAIGSFSQVGNAMLANASIDAKFGLINTKGEELTPFKYSSIGAFKGDVALVLVDTKFGLINSNGKELIPIKYSSIGTIVSGRVIVSAEGKFGVVTIADGVEIIPLIYSEIGNYSSREGMAPAMLNGKWGYIDYHKEVIAPVYDKVSPFSMEKAEVVKNGETYMIDMKGERYVTPAVVKPVTDGYDTYRGFSEGLAAVNKGYIASIPCCGKWGFIDQTGKVVVPLIYHEVKDFSNGLAVIRDANKKMHYGMIDKTGKVVLPADYYEIKSFADGMAAVQNTKFKWGFVDKTGKLVIPCKYDETMDFFMDKAGVKQNDKWFDIDKTGKKLP